MAYTVNGVALQGTPVGGGLAAGATPADPRKKPPTTVGPKTEVSQVPNAVRPMATPNAPGTQTSAVPAPSATPIFPGAPLVNTAPMNPDLQELANDYKSRLAQSRGGENAADPRLTDQYNQYQSRLNSDTTHRAIGRATLANADMAAGQKQAYAEAAAAKGISGTGAGADVSGRIDEAARRRSAGAAADISLGREGQLDALTLGGLGIAGAQSQLNLARAGQTNALYGNAVGVVGAPAQQNLAERSFNLQQYQTQAQIDLARQAQEQARQAQQEQAYRNALTAIPSSGVTAPFNGGGGGGGGTGGGGYYNGNSRGGGLAYVGF